MKAVQQQEGKTDPYISQHLRLNAKRKSITDRWHKDELYRNSQSAIGWAKEYCQYLDSLMSIDVWYTATWKERERYENNDTLNGQGMKPYESDSVQLKKKRDWNVNRKVGVGTIGHNLLPLLQHGGVHKKGKSHRDHNNGKDARNGKNKYSDLWVVILHDEPLQKWKDHQSFLGKILAHVYRLL